MPSKYYKYKKKGFFRTKTCRDCGKEYQGTGCSVRCHECREKFLKAYIHAYAKGIYLKRNNWVNYYKTYVAKV